MLHRRSILSQELHKVCSAGGIRFGAEVWRLAGRHHRLLAVMDTITLTGERQLLLVMTVMSATGNGLGSC